MCENDASARIFGWKRHFVTFGMNHLESDVAARTVQIPFIFRAEDFRIIRAVWTIRAIHLDNSNGR
jgi:hypothetical protein